MAGRLSKVPAARCTARRAVDGGAGTIMIAAAVTADVGPDELRSHLDGLAAIMESQFRFEERALHDTLSSLDLDADPHTLLGPL